jgi:hypothetical protein
LQDVDITLLTSDFRIAQEARNFGIKESVGIDVVRNIPHISHNGDKLIFDSAEANPIMLEDMRQYFSKFLRISDDADEIKAEGEFLLSPYLEGEQICKAVAVDEAFFGTFEKSVPMSYFFGDDDYEKDLEKHLDFVEGLDAYLQLGYYYFLDYEDMLREKFKKIFEFEEYETMIKSTDILLSASPQAVLDSLASGGRPVYFQREDYPRDFVEFFKELNIPIIDNYDKNQLSVVLETLNNRKYGIIEQNGNKIAQFIKVNLNL